MHEYDTADIPCRRPKGQARRIEGRATRIRVARSAFATHHWPVKENQRSESESRPLVPLLTWTAVVAVALALGLSARAPQMPAGMGRMLPRVPGPPQSIPVLMYMLGVGSVAWYAITIGFPILLLGARRTSTEKFTVSRVVAMAITAFVVGLTLTLAADYLLTYPAGFRPPFVAYLPDGLRRDALPWIALIAIVAAIEARRRAVTSRVERERLRAQIAEQRLVALTGQLQPHFLFNTLQGISTLIHRDPDAADEMLGKLSDLLREVLRHRDQALVRLGDEIRYAQTYLEIAQIRFADRLKFSIDVPQDLRNAAVPLFILQPLVENSIGHGIGGQALGGSISVSAHRDGDRLTLEVEDNGAGLQANAEPVEGVGLGNTRERLRASFSDDASLVLKPAKGGGTIARIEMPYRPLQ